MKKSTVISAAAAIAILMGSQAMTAASQPDFKDMDGHWAAESVNKAVASGYVDGYDDGTFKPDKSVTRAEFIKLLASATDRVGNIDGGIWYQKYLSGLEDKNIVHEIEFNNYDKPISRLEMAKMALRAVRPDLQMKGYSDYSDNEYMFDAVALGLIQGLSNGVLGLDTSTTRAQAITIIERVLIASKQGKLEVDKRALQTAEYALNNTNLQAVFGMKTTKFPFTVPVRSDVNATIKGLVVIDGDDQESPFRYLLDGMEREDTGTSTSGEYIFAFNTDLTFNAALSSSMLVYDYFNMMKSIRLTSKSSAYAIPNKTPAGTVINNYALFAIKKDRIDSMVKNNKLEADLVVDGRFINYLEK